MGDRLNEPQTRSERFQTILRYHEDHGYNHSSYADKAVYDLIRMVQRQDALVGRVRELEEALRRIDAGWAAPPLGAPELIHWTQEIARDALAASGEEQE